MAVVSPTRNDTETAAMIAWTNMQIGDTGAAIDVSDLDFNKSFHIVSAGAGTAQITRSDDGVNFVNLTGGTQPSPAGTIVDLQSANKSFAIGAVAGAATSVILAARKLIIHT